MTITQINGGPQILEKSIPDSKLVESALYNTFTLFGNPLESGIHYLGGFYQAPSTDANLTESLTTQTLGSINNPYSAYVFVVTSSAGTATGGSGIVEVEISGTSIDDAGVRTTSDTEVIIADVTTQSLNEYLESTKKWVGQITFTIKNAGAGTHVNFSSDFNYGFSIYETFNDLDVTLKEIKFDGYANSTDTSFNLEFLKHSTIGWEYNTTAFTPGGSDIILNSGSVFGTEKELNTGQYFGFRRTGLSTIINNSSKEGFLIKITTGTIDSISRLTINTRVIKN